MLPFSKEVIKEYLLEDSRASAEVVRGFRIVEDDY